MNVFDLAAVLTLNSSQYDQGLADAKTNAEGFGSKFKKIGTVIAGGMAAGGAAIAALSKKSVDAYAEYEQLSGGIKKLYQDASESVMTYANNAYKTSGMSANQYMEQASSFSAALVNSLGGNYAAAAKQTDVAMRAISDNFNTFGGDMSMIQGAFQGFAKQNYTMLDNLKLGYGGTKTEMERLIEDANTWAKENGKAADLSIDSFSDVVTAIDYIQQKQHIAGTTAKEAATTIEGSLNMAKSAWENLLTGFADPEQDIGELAANFVDSFVTAASNVVPRFIEAFKGIAEGIPEIVTSLVETFKTNFTGFQSVGLEMINQITSGIAGNVQTFISAALPMIAKFSESLRANAGKLVDSGIALILSLAQGLINSLPTLITYVPVIVTNIAGIINDNAPKLIGAGLRLVIMLAQGLIKAIPVLVKNIPAIVKAIFAAFMAVSWGGIGKSMVKGIAKGIKGLAGSVKGAAGQVAKNAMNAVKAGFAHARELGANVIKAIGSALRAGVSIVVGAARALATRVISTIRNGFSNIGDVGMNLVRGIWNGISNGLGWIKGMIAGWVGNVKSFLKGLFGIHSPSKWARDEIGKNLVYGIADGIDDESGLVDSALAELVDVPDISIGTKTVGANEDLFGMMKSVQMVNNITVDGAENPEEYASRFVRQMQMDMRMV